MRPLLGVSRLISERHSSLTVPSTAVVAVGIDRAKIEKIRKAKGVKVQLFEEVLNLSRSRYYRWLQYSTDLPLEFIVGIKKLLGLSNSEFLRLFTSNTEDFLDTLLVAVYENKKFSTRT